MSTTKAVSELKRQKSLLDFYSKSQNSKEETKDSTSETPSTSEPSGKRKREFDSDKVSQKLQKMTNPNQLEVEEEEGNMILLSDYKNEKFKLPLPIQKGYAKAQFPYTNKILDQSDLSFSRDSLDLDTCENTKATMVSHENSMHQEHAHNMFFSQENTIFSAQDATQSANSSKSKFAPSRDENQASDPPAMLSKQTLDIISSLRAEKNKPKFRPAPEIVDKIAQISERNRSPISQTTSQVLNRIMTRSPLRSPLKILEQTRSPQILNQILRSRSPSPNVLNSPSIREKYHDLIQPEREFILPIEYKKLFQLFESLDFMLNIYVLQKKPTFLPDLLANIENTYKSRITTKHIAQILYVNPKAYNIYWEKNEKSNKEYQLYITFADENIETDAKIFTKSAKLEERKKSFKARLLEITKEFHQEFLQTLPLEEQQKDFDGMKAWHLEFKVHNVPQIPEASLPPKPQTYVVQSIEEFLRQGDIKNKAVEQTLAKTAQEISQRDDKPKTVSLPVMNTSKSNLSDRLLEMIKEKEKRLAEELSIKESQKKKPEMNARLAIELKKIAEIVYFYYIQRDVSNMFLVNVIEHLSNAKNAYLLSNISATESLQKLVKLCPNWLSTKEISKGVILMVNKRVGLAEIYRLIDKESCQ